MRCAARRRPRSAAHSVTAAAPMPLGRRLPRHVPTTVTAACTHRAERPDGGLYPEDQPARVDAWNALLRTEQAKESRAAASLPRVAGGHYGVGVASAHVDMFFDDRNTARQTRGRFGYQDEAVALRCIANLLSGDVTVVVVEWSTDYIAVLADGDPELVSIKHREPDRGAWPTSELVKPLRDLHRVWREMGERCRCAFASNAAVAHRVMTEFDQLLGR